MASHMVSILNRELHSSRIDTMVGDRPIVAFINRNVKEFIFIRLYDMHSSEEVLAEARIFTDGRRFVLQCLEVTNGKRHRGLGNALMQFIKTVFASSGAQLMELEIRCSIVPGGVLKQFLRHYGILCSWHDGCLRLTGNIV